MVSGPTEEEGIQEVEDEEVGRNEEDEVKEMRLTFEGFELVREIHPSSFLILTFKQEIR